MLANTCSFVCRIMCVACDSESSGRGRLHEITASIATEHDEYVRVNGNRVYEIILNTRDMLNTLCVWHRYESFRFIIKLTSSLRPRTIASPINFWWMIRWTTSYNVHAERYVYMNLIVCSIEQPCYHISNVDERWEYLNGQVLKTFSPSTQLCRRRYNWKVRIRTANTSNIR